MYDRQTPNISQESSVLLNYNELRQLWTTRLNHEQEVLDREYENRHPLEQAMAPKIFHPDELTGLFHWSRGKSAPSSQQA